MMLFRKNQMIMENMKGEIKYNIIILGELQGIQ